MKALRLILLMLLFVLTSNAQNNNNGIIKGKIIDQNTKQALPYVNIVITGANTGAVSDTLGLFILKDIQSGQYQLKVSFIGYQTKVVKDIQVVPNKSAYVDIELNIAITTMDAVTVKAFRFENTPLKPISSFSLSREEINRSPGAAGDILRTIGMLPGVQSSGGEFSAIAVRGQGIYNNVYMVDGIPVYSLGHFEGNHTGFNDPNGGRFSILPPRIVQTAEFSAGGFSSEFGRRNAAFLGLTLKEGNPETYSIEGQIDLMGGMLSYDGPSKIHKNTSLFLAARYQNFEQVFKMTGMDNDGVPQYADFIFKSTTKIGKKNKLSIIGMYNINRFDKDIKHLLLQEEITEDHLSDAEENKSVFGLNLRTLTSKNSYWTNILYYRNYDRNYIIGKTDLSEKPDGSLPDESEINYIRDLLNWKKNEQEIGYRSIFTYIFNNKSRLRCGIDFSNLSLNYSRILSQADTSYVFSSSDYRPDETQKFIVSYPQFVNMKFDNNAFNLASYLQYSFFPIKRLHFNVGLRYDYYGFSETHTLSPRLSGSYQINEKNSLNFATGIFYQDNIPDIIADNQEESDLKTEKSIHYILGYKKYFTPNLKLTIEGYYKDFSNLIVREARNTKFFTNNGTGYAYGLDFSIVKRFANKYHGQIGYSYMQSKRDNNNGKDIYDHYYSMPHIFSALISYDINKHWIVSSKFRYFTGKPTDEYIIHRNVHNNDEYMRYSQEIISNNTDRLDNYLSLDLRVDYRYQFNKFALMFFIDIANITDRLNPNYMVLRERTGEVIPKGTKMFPTFGLKFEL